MVATKKKMRFCHPLQKFPLPGGDYFTCFTKAQKLPSPPRLCQQARLDVLMYTHICLSSHDITETFRFALFIRYVPKRFCQQRAASPA